MDAPHTSPAPASPLARYEQATAPDGWLTSSGWARLADDLDHDAVLAMKWSMWLAAYVHTEASRKLTDRAADCRARAAAMTRGAL